MAKLRGDQAMDDRSPFSDSDISSDVLDHVEITPKRKGAVKEKDAEEEELERMIFGAKAGFREALFAQDDDANTALQRLDLNEPMGAETGLEAPDDSALFFYDPDTPSAGRALAQASQTSAADPNAPAWEDSDDERLSISLASVGLLRKLRETEADDVVSGTEYARRLRQQYLRLVPLPEWATEGEKRQTKRRRRSSAASDSDSEEEAGEYESALPLESFLRSVKAFNSAGMRKKRKLRPEVIDIQKTRDIPDSHTTAVESLSFHPKHPVLLSASQSSILNLHHIDPSAHPTPNPLLTSVQVQQVPIKRSAFLSPEGKLVVFAGRRRFLHTWDISTGQVKKITRIQGHRLEHKTMERFRLSPTGGHMALVASDSKGGGMVNILSVDTMQWVAQVRLDSKGGIADLAWWSDGDGLTILGRDGQVGEWSLGTRRYVGIWRDEGSIGGTVMALGGPGGPEAIGDDRWIAIGSTSGILNIYDRHTLLETSKNGDVEIKPTPTPTRCFEQLVTSITSITFTPDGQLLAFASQLKRDALRLVHLPSCTVYRNWPTDQTPLGRISAMAFNSDSNVLAVGNDTGKTRLWEIRS